MKRKRVNSARSYEPGDDLVVGDKNGAFGPKSSAHAKLTISLERR